ncbi:hypothetical protein L1049_015233 [Liquidambar formosana]|uniref:Uncharacterized protein n=1 Tax=Liquidambar formosana TaxID=63359 RepID=A0AAP0RYS6_LIQFO
MRSEAIRGNPKWTVSLLVKGWDVTNGIKAEPTLRWWGRSHMTCGLLGGVYYSDQEPRVKTLEARGQDG